MNPSRTDATVLAHFTSQRPTRHPANVSLTKRAGGSIESQPTFDGVLPVRDGDGGVYHLQGLLEQQRVPHVVGHNACPVNVETKVRRREQG